MSILIREEQRGDWPAVHTINVAAFEQSQEAELVDALRAEATPCVSLVAQEHGVLVGHIMFSPVVLSGTVEAYIAGLAPMAVLPAHQRSGIGSQLVREGLKRCRQQGFSAVVVLGHADYYPRFGFQPSINFAISSQYDVPAEVFMALELQPNALQHCAGTVQYHPAFSRL